MFMLRCNTLAARMPAELVVHTSGHELKNIMSSMFDYLDANLAVSMPGFVVLAGFPPFPWGQLGMGPSAPSLAALGSAQLDASGPSPVSPGPAQAVLPLGCPFKSLQGVVDGLFQLDTASPPVLGWGGRLRPLTHAAFAAIVMYHGELAYPEPDP